MEAYMKHPNNTHIRSLTVQANIEERIAVQRDFVQQFLNDITKKYALNIVEPAAKSAKRKASSRVKEVLSEVRDSSAHISKSRSRELARKSKTMSIPRSGTRSRSPSTRSRKIVAGSIRASESRIVPTSSVTPDRIDHTEARSPELDRSGENDGRDDLAESPEESTENTDDFIETQNSLAEEETEVVLQVEEDVAAFLKSNEFEILRVPADGNCQFHAVVMGMQSSTVTSFKTGVELREHLGSAVSCALREKSTDGLVEIVMSHVATDPVCDGDPAKLVKMLRDVECENGKDS
jgi:hypothetical protein